VDVLFQSAQTLITKGSSRDLGLAADRLHWGHGLCQYDFCVKYFSIERENRHLAADPSFFDRAVAAVAAGGVAVAARDKDALREALALPLARQGVFLGGDMQERERASLMRR
jgi:hypothetical protein